MKQATGILSAVALAATLAGGAYWLGMRHGGGAAAPAQPQEHKENKPLYYRNPMGLADTSPTPKKDPMGMDYIPVYESEPPSSSAAANQIANSIVIGDAVITEVPL